MASGNGRPLDIDELVEAGELVPVRIEGLRDVYYLPKGARTPKPRDYQALLAPFDPVVWQRQRTHDLFGFHYRLEIYTPAPQRKHGYYDCRSCWVTDW